MSKNVVRDQQREVRLQIHDLMEQHCKNCDAARGLKAFSRWAELKEVCNGCDIQKQAQELARPLWEVSPERKKLAVGEAYFEPVKEVKKPMAARTKQRGKIVPAKSKEAEQRAAVNSPVKSYTMSPEELEDLRARTGYREPAAAAPPPENRSSEKQAERAHKRHDGRAKQGPDNGKTREDFLHGVAAGKTVTAIEKEWGMKPGTLAYWVGKWNVRGFTPGRAREMLAKTDSNAGAEPVLPDQGVAKEVELGVHNEAVWQLTVEDFNKAFQSVEEHRLRAEKAESDLRSEELKMETQRRRSDKAEQDLTRMREQLLEEQRGHEEAVELLNETKRRLNVAEEKLAAAEAAAMVLHHRQTEPAAAPTYPFPVIALTYGLIDFGGDRAAQREKCIEEADEYSTEVEAANIDINRAASELYDAGQAFVGLIRKQLQELLVDNTDDAVRRYFEKQNR
uniref:hypothetical protein n=1 Tax=Gorillibacterium sp. sgz5001074 TaxID=3446695 RepID=UPI003F67B28B